MSEERKITAGTISGATLKSIGIEPSIIVDGKSYTASEFNKAVEMLKQPQLNENQQVLSGSELIGVIYSQLLEDFGFGYIEKDLWMIAENLSEKIANDQPKLIPNQQIVLEWLKKQYFQGYGPAIIITIHLLQKLNDIDVLGDEPVTKAYRALNTAGEAVVVKMFAAWALEQEEG